MNSINDIINVCTEALDEGIISDANLAEILDLTRAIMENISIFVDNNGVDWSEYPHEYLDRSRTARESAIETFADILEVVEEYCGVDY